MEVRRSRWLVPAALALGVAVAATGAAADTKALLEAPTSPGTVALLVTRASEPGVAERLAEALRDVRPEVRAAAARVANVAGAGSLRPSLLAALRTEAAPPAALEEMRAIAALGGPAADEDLIEAVKHHRRFVALLATTLARARGAPARLHLPALRALGLDSAGLVSFLLDLYAVDPDSLDALGAIAVRESAAEAWAALLQSARAAGQRPGVPILCASLTSPAPGVRAATYWDLLLAPDGHGAGDIERGLGSSPESTGEGGDARSTFAFELLRRRSGQHPARRPEWMELLRNAAGPQGLPWEVRDARILKELDAVEMATLSTALTGEPDGLDDARNRGRPPSPLRTPMRSRLGRVEWDSMRMPSGFPPGFVRDLVAVTRCKAAAPALGGGVVRYRADGRPNRISIFTPESECPELVRALVVTALSPPRKALEHTAVVLVPLGRDSLACMADAASPSGTEVPTSLSPPPAGPGKDGIRKPKKIRDVRPVYPEAARRARVQGTVEVEAQVSTTGCIEALEVLRSVPGLDLAAFAAVSQWRYTPTRARGVSVPIIMSVTVNFELH